MVYFNKDAQESLLFTSDLERLIFGEAILWSNPGTLDENKIQDLKYLRRILHAAHTLDLRRMLSFDGERIQKDMMNQLFGDSLPLEADTVRELLWSRSKNYLITTGNRDLVEQRDYQDCFLFKAKILPN